MKPARWSPLRFAIVGFVLSAAWSWLKLEPPGPDEVYVYSWVIARMCGAGIAGAIFGAAIALTRNSRIR